MDLGEERREGRDGGRRRPRRRRGECEAGLDPFLAPDTGMAGDADDLYDGKW